jgi:hypothetical protein
MPGYIQLGGKVSEVDNIHNDHLVRPGCKTYYGYSGRLNPPRVSSWEINSVLIPLGQQEDNCTITVGQLVDDLSIPPV